MATISVIIPTFNRAGIISATLRSVIQQERSPDEIIVVDDGSTDGTAEIVRGFHPLVRYFWKKNQYLGAARNFGLRRASGDRLLFLDSDDLLMPGALRQLSVALECCPESPLSFGRAVGFDDAGNVELETLEDRGCDPETVLLASSNFIRTSGCVLIRREFMKSAGPWDTHLRGVEDWDMWLRLSLLGRFARTEETVLRYRVHKCNMSSDQRMMALSSALFILKHSRHSAAMAHGDPLAWRKFQNSRPRALNVMMHETLINAMAGRFGLLRSAFAEPAVYRIGARAFKNMLVRRLNARRLFGRV